MDSKWHVQVGELVARKLDVVQSARGSCQETDARQGAQSETNAADVSTIKHFMLICRVFVNFNWEKHFCKPVQFLVDTTGCTA